MLAQMPVDTVEPSMRLQVGQQTCLSAVKTVAARKYLKETSCKVAILVEMMIHEEVLIHP